MTVEITIHRSAEEIGGNCIEVRCGDSRLVLDVGEPLSAESRRNRGEMVPRTLERHRPVDAVVISHPHQDHYGLLQELPAEWPIYCGRASEKLIRLSLAVAGRPLQRELRNYESGSGFVAGPFNVTPILTDHSAFDAHMLLIEVAGRRVLYTGDFRMLGRKAALPERLMRHPPEGLDVLLMEGTTLGRTEAFPTEAELEETFVDLMRATRGQLFVTWSAQNIDRTVTLFRACRRAGRLLVLDIYAADVLEQMAAHARLPALGSDGLLVVITNRMKWLYGERLSRPEFVDACVRHGISARRFKEAPGRYVVMLRDSLLEDFESAGFRPSPCDAYVFSMWRGYQEHHAYAQLSRAFAIAGAPVKHIHTSGHASRQELVRFAEAMAPRSLIPIHSFEWDAHVEGFSNVVRLKDGETFELP